jgi:prophage maintenance system killer protein
MFIAENLEKINKKFARGVVVNKSSLEFALSSIKSKGWMDQVAYLVRALLLDHVFEDGNKRTTAVIIAAYYTEFEIGFDAQRLDEIIIEIASKSISDISKIKELIKSVIR